jgi:hypothetical protein
VSRLVSQPTCLHVILYLSLGNYVSRSVIQSVNQNIDMYLNFHRRNYFENQKLFSVNSTDDPAFACIRLCNGYIKIDTKTHTLYVLIPPKSVTVSVQDIKSDSKLLSQVPTII